MPKPIQSGQEVKGTEFYTIDELLDQMEQEGLDSLDPKKLHATPPYTVATFLNRLSAEECRVVLRKVPELDASAILAEMDADASAEIVATMREWRALRILEEFDPDDAVDVISELEEPDRVRLLSKLPNDQARQLRALLKYESDTAGGVMTPRFASVRLGTSVDDAIKYIRQKKDEINHTTHVYLVDKGGMLKGVLSMRMLILAKPEQKVDEIMCTELKGVCSPQEDREKIALTMAELNLYALPVVDEQGRLLGIVEHDDVIDILQSEATEDIQKLVGAGGDEGIHDSIFYSIQRRSPWLVVNLLTAFLSASVISFYQEQISQITLLAVLMPIVASLAGNTGSQTLAVAIRSIALGEVQTLDDFHVCLKEGFKGALNGLVIGIISSFVAWFFSGDVRLALVLFTAMALTMAVGGIVGAFIPIMLKRFKFDPAQSSSIFVTSITDACGFLIFLSLGAWLLF